MNDDLFWHRVTVSRAQREKSNGHRSFVLWFTGLSGAGKSTLAHAVDERLHRIGCRSSVFDGDNVRHGLCADLGFSDRDRSENLRRIGEMGKLFLEAGVIALAAFISPRRADRDRVRAMFGDDDFYEIFVDCPLAVCEGRDVKGVYRRARAGEISHFTGISAPYEAPERPELTLRTDQLTLAASVEEVMRLIQPAMATSPAATKD